jgi:hypothetical protein
VKNNREETVKVKSSRRHNASGKHATVNFNVQRSSPMFRAEGNVLVHVKTGDKIARGKNNRWMSISKNAKPVLESSPPVSPMPKDTIVLDTL